MFRPISSMMNCETSNANTPGMLWCLTDEHSNRRVRPCLGKRLARTGAAAVEFAIIANVMFLIVLSCIEFARMNMVRNLAQDAAYYGARQAMVPGATADEAKDVAENIMGAMLPGGYEVTVQAIDADSEEVEVNVSVQLHDVALLMPLFLPDTSIESTAKMRTERYQGFFQQD